MSKIIQIILISIIVIGSLFAAYSFQRHTYVKGKYGQKCYTIENMNRNIKYPIYFDSLEDCLNTLIVN